MHCLDVEEKRRLFGKALLAATDKLSLLYKRSNNLLRALFHGLKVPQN